MCVLPGEEAHEPLSTIQQCIHLLVAVITRLKEISWDDKNTENLLTMNCL